MTKAAFGFSIKAGTGRRVPQERDLLPWRSPGWPSGALLPSSCRPSVHSSHACRLSLPPPGWLKVLGAWEGGLGLAEFCRRCPCCPQRALI